MIKLVSMYHAVTLICCSTMTQLIPAEYTSRDKKQSSQSDVYLYDVLTLAPWALEQ
jgi:hypothetical protein